MGRVRLVIDHEYIKVQCIRCFGLYTYGKSEAMENVYRTQNGIRENVLEFKCRKCGRWMLVIIDDIYPEIEEKRGCQIQKRKSIKSALGVNDAQLSKLLGFIREK
jgi:hypothetical protein